MTRRKRGRFRRRTYVAGIVGISLAALLLPESLTGRLISLVQVIVPFQHAATSATDSVRNLLPSDSGTVSADDYFDLQRENEALAHQVAALSSQTIALSQEVEWLTAARTWEVDGQGIGQAGRLIPATIITEDLLPWRASRIINVGSLQGVRRGAAVASHHFSIDRGQDVGLRDGLAILFREVLIGETSDVAPHTSRIRLLSDPGVEKKVRIGRFTDGTFILAEPFFWLTGHGKGVMRIENVDRRDVDAGIVAVGDMVLAEPTSGRVPAALVIGTISAIEPDRKKPLLSILTVLSAIDEASLQRVYIYDPGSHPPTP